MAIVALLAQALALGIFLFGSVAWVWGDTYETNPPLGGGPEKQQELREAGKYLKNFGFICSVLGAVGFFALLIFLES